VRTLRPRRLLAVSAALLVTLALLHAPLTGQAQYPGYPGKIAFVRSPTPGAPSNIYIADPDGTNLEKLTSVSGEYGALDWSANGQKLAYEQTYNGIGEIWIMDADGSNPKLVSPVGVSRYSPSWSPDGRYLAVSSSTEIYRLDVVAGHEQILKETDTIGGTCLGHPYELPVYYSHPAWSPEGARIAVVRSHEFPPVPVGNACDFNPNFKIDLAVMGAGGGGVTKLTNDSPISAERFDGLPDWSPDGSEIAFMRGNASSTFGIAIIPSGGGNPVVMANGFGARPRWSPDGEMLLITRDQNGDTKSDLWAMDAQNGSLITKVLQDSSHNLYQDWQPILAGEMDVTLEAFAPNGKSVEDTIALAQTITVKLRIVNTGETKLSDFKFAFDAPLVIDEQSTGGLEIVSGPDPANDPDLILKPGERRTYTFELSATANGRVAAHTKVTARNEHGVKSEEFHSLLFDIADGAEVTDSLGRWVFMEAMDQFLQKVHADWYGGMAARGNALVERLRQVLSPSKQMQWFGSLTELPLTAFDHALARLRGVAPESVAASMPKQDLDGDATIALMEQTYNASFKAELGKGVEQYVEGYAGLTAAVKKGLADSYSEAVLTGLYVLGNATPEERMQFEAYAMTLMDGIDSDAGNVYHTVIDKVENWQLEVLRLDEALDTAVADVFLLSPDLQAQMAQETVWRQQMLDLASTDPVGFQHEWAKRDAEIANLVVPVILDTLLGGAIFKAGAKLNGVIVSGKGAAVLRAGEASGVVEAGGTVTKAPKTAIKPSTSAKPAGVPLSDVAEAERSASYLDNVEGATIIQSTDVGHVYELPNVGGVPEVTIEAKAGILKQLETEYATHSGEQLKLAEVLKPSSALRKADGIAKLELTPAKTGKAAMLDAGAPREVLAEANYWRTAVSPDELPGFSDLSHARQKAALKEWNKANKAWAEWENPTPGSKEAKLKQCIGQRSRVPLDDAPNKAGIQRFVTAEFEEVSITQGQSEAKLIRAKYYEVEVVDTKTGQTLNRKTIVDSPEALPQTPDADAVALAKVVGQDELGNPIIAPLSRAEREFVGQRYIDKNIKARKKKPGTPGAIPDAAEHGVTMVMDDASASVAGKLIARYGAIFQPARVGKGVLKRISPFVAKAGATADEIAATYKELLAIAESEGGFGQHAIVVTADSRYLGEVNFASW